MTEQEDLDYADNIGLQSSNHQDAQQKAEHLSKTASTIGHKVNTKKTNVLRKNTRVKDPVMIDGKHIEDLEEFTYFGTNMTTTGDCDQETNKANEAFAMLKPALRTTILSVHIKIKVFRSNVLSVLLYGAESWKKTSGIPDQIPSTHSQDLLT